MRKCLECHQKDPEPGTDICFRCRIRGVGFTFRGGALVGHAGWHRTEREHLNEHFGVDSGKELARTRPDIGRADP